MSILPKPFTKYAGIGSRKTPTDVQGLRIAEHYKIPVINLGDEVFGYDG